MTANDPKTRQPAGPDCSRTCPHPHVNCPSDRQLYDFAIGKLPLDEADRIADTIDMCAECEKSVTKFESQSSDRFINEMLGTSVDVRFQSESELQRAIRQVEAIPSSRADSLEETIAYPNVEDDMGFGDQAHAPADAPMQYGEYVVTGILAEGGMGSIWKAHDPVLRREVALKEIREEQAQNPLLRRRFLREAQVTGQLEHPNIVPVHELGRDDKGDRLFYTMRLVQGETLREVIKEQHHKYGRHAPESSRRLLNKFVNICEAMAYAHARGVVHRDLKPQNVVIGEFGEVVVMDWGLAKVGDKDDDSARTVGLSSGAGGQQTVAGQAMGTPAYMAPEQAAGSLQEIDRRTDVYGLGAILFEILTGSPPHRAPTTDAILEAILNREAPSTRDRLSTVPKPLDAICATAMAKSPGDRYSSALHLAHDIQHWLDDEPVSVCPESWFRREALVASKPHTGWLCSHVGVARRELRRLAERKGSSGVSGRTSFWSRVLTQQRDEARVHSIYGDTSRGLELCNGVLARERIQYAPSELQKIADQSDPQASSSAGLLLDALAEVALLKARGELVQAPNATQPENRFDAAAKSIQFAMECGRAKRATQLFHASLLKQQGKDVEYQRVVSDALESAFTSSLDHFLAGDVSRHAGDFEQAIRHYEEALGIDPTHFWSHLLMGYCRFELGRSEQALESYNQAVRLQPRYAWVYATRALAYADIGQWDAAEADLKKAVELDPGFYGTYNNRGVVWYTRAVTDKTAPIAQRKAWLKGAIEQYTMASRLNEQFENAYNNYGLAAQELARQLQAEGADETAKAWLQDAEQKFAKAMTAGSNRVAACVNSAILAAEFANSDEAKFDEARFDLVQADKEVRRLDGASRKSAERLIAFGRAWVYGLQAEPMVRSASSADDLSAAATAVETALQQFARVVPESPDGNKKGLPQQWPSSDHLARDARLARARLRFQLFQKLTRFDESAIDDRLLLPLMSDLDVLVDLNPGRLTNAERGEVFAMRGNVRSFRARDGGTLAGDVLADYGRALEADPNNASLRLRRGWILAMSQPRALAEFNLALSGQNALTEPSLLADAYNGRGYVLALAGEDKQAVADAIRALELAASDWKVLFNAAVIYALSADIAAREQADAERATQYTEQAVNLLEKTLAILQAGDLEWKKKWRVLLEQERGLIAIRKHDRFKALLH